ncbi:MAG: tRNA-dihydrouridine synthase [Gammaproteobacteria bacterium]|nr:tRNA-dihydrouridine synthase [Gammaproteobacteria bacterium]MCF6230656.1 tRNA-dihydrouridine synthase [Gammaproteobacteria bacterium]
MKILLAPMQGVVDQQMRAFLTNIGGLDLCVSEFVRVTDRLLPRRVFRRICPELLHDGVTPAGTPVVVQLLGGIPEIVAVNAQRAIEMGAKGIDINFGCPSRFVNRKAGGAVLLKEPERVQQIVAAVRAVVPADIPFSAKIRLGYDDTTLALENAHAVETGGADSVVVHGRTKKEGYRPPADWHWIARIRASLTIPVVANGDINSVEEYLRCRYISGCDDVMIGRGVIINPGLIQQIRQFQSGRDGSGITWQSIIPLIETMLLEGLAAQVADRHIVSRLKQWLCYLKQHYSEAQQLFDKIRTLNDPQQVRRLLHK